MASYLGIDTSNYTTSVSLYNDNKTIIQEKKLLEVAQNQLGLRQSDAVFQHIQRLPSIIKGVFAKSCELPVAVGASISPRNQEGSYMPCFTVGTSVAKSISSVLNVPFYSFSHQQGHIVAALYSANRLDLLNKEFISFHVSGGTTECVYVHPKLEKIDIISKTLDLNAGQLIDRIGKLLGLRFPAGKELEILANSCTENIKVKPTLKGLDCCLSGVENKCIELKRQNFNDSYIARYCIEYVSKTIFCMYEEVIKKHGKLPAVFAGGVMSNKIIKDNLLSKYPVIFAKPCFSSDNAVGISILTAMKAGNNEK